MSKAFTKETEAPEDDDDTGAAVLLAVTSMMPTGRRCSKIFKTLLFSVFSLPNLQSVNVCGLAFASMTEENSERLARWKDRVSIYC